MRLDDLIQQLVHLWDQGAPLEYEVRVTLDGNEFTIDRVSPESDGVLIILET